MQRLIPAFTAVYSSLSPEQRKAADDAFRYQQQRRRARMMQNGQMPPGQMQPGQN